MPARKSDGMEGRNQGRLDEGEGGNAHCRDEGGGGGASMKRQKMAAPTEVTLQTACGIDVGWVAYILLVSFRLYLPVVKQCGRYICRGRVVEIQCRRAYSW